MNTIFRVTIASTIIVCVALACLTSLFIFTSAFAQENNANQVTRESTEQGALLATVNIQNASFTVEGSTLTIDFDISNRIGIQPGIKYGVTLAKNSSKGLVVVDEFVYDEEINLSENEQVHKSITYTPRHPFGGEYTILLSAKNSSGFPFSTIKVGTTTLPENIVNTKVYIYPETCYLTIEGQIDDTQYMPYQGVDITLNETLLSNCVVENLTNEDIELMPVFVSKLRSSFGNSVVAEGGDTSSIHLQSREKKVIETRLPKASTAQAYDVSLSYSVRGDESNFVRYHYVIQGGSGTVQNVIFDKNEYKKNEVAKVSFYWTAAADNFDGARKTDQTTLTEPTISFAVTDQYGKACSDVITHPLDEGYRLIHESLVMVDACVFPTITLSLSDKILGELSILKMSTKPASTEPVSVVTSDDVSKEVFAKDNKISFVLILISLFLLVAAGVMYKIKKGNTHTPDMHIPLVFMFFVFMSAFCMYAETVQADTYTSGNLVITTTLDKAAYAPNEPMTISQSMYQTGCNNTGISVDTMYGHDGDVSKYMGGGYLYHTTAYLGATTNAPVVAGSHMETFRTTANSIQHNYALPFTVSSSATYTYTFNSSGGTPTYSSVTGVTGSAVASPGKPTRTGYTFSGWLPSLPTTMPSGGGGSVAQWTSSPSSYTYTFNGNGATTNPSPTSVTQNSGTAISAPTAPLRTGYSFAGWSPAIPATMPVGGGSSAAQWTTTVAAPTVTTDTVGSITGTSAIIQGSVNPNGADATSFFKFGLTSAGCALLTTRTPAAGGDIKSGSTVQTYSQTLSGLTPSTVYYYCALATNSAGTGRGTVLSFTTASSIYTYSFNSNGGAPTYSSITGVTGSAVASPGTPTRAGFTFTGWSPSLPTTMPSGGGSSVAQWTVTPAAPTVISSTHANIAQTTATLGATVFSGGSSAITARGTCWGLSTSPVSNCAAEGGTAVSAFTHARSGFSPGTTYYYRGYATNAVGTGYSADSSFETLANVPVSLTATPQACGTGQNFLDWADAAGADNYSIYSNTGVWIGNSIGSNYTHTGSLGTSYSYYVRANNTAGVQSGNSATVSATTAGACVVYSCTGSNPANAGVLCTNDDTGLSADTPKTAVGSCTATKCEYTCNAGYVFSAGLCIPITYTCTGSIPSNANICALDDQSLGVDTPRTVVSSCTSTKCEYICTVGYSAVAGACIALPTLTASPVIVNQGSQTTLTWTLGGQTCTLNGGIYNNVSLSANGSFTPTINANTTYTLTCPSGIATVTVEIIPTGFET